MSGFFSNFHFIHPLWLLAVVPLALLLWFIIHPRATDNAWSSVIDENLLPLLINKSTSKQSGTLLLWLLSAGWLITILALADPAWEKKPKPVFQTDTARVIVMDLSRSMSITDLKPSRLARARFKIEDILRKKGEGQIGLVAFAGDAFTVSPLTRDVETIRALLPSLTPSIMPIQGSRADLGLIKAGELLKQSGLVTGEILLMADGADSSLAKKAAKKLLSQGYQVSVMAVGTKKGGTIPNATDRAGRKITVPVKLEDLKGIAEAGGGRYSPVTDTMADINYLTTNKNPTHGGKDSSSKADDIQSTDWKEQGPLLILLLLPIAAFAFRRGWLVGIVFIVTLAGQPQPALAFGWDDLWQRSDQQADKALQTGDFEKASNLASQPLRRGSADYKRGDYESALQAFSEAEGVEATYNKGNALAKLGKYKEAIKAYENTLQQQPDMEDATTNKKRIEDLLKQQEKEKKQQNKDQKDKDKKSDQQKSDKENDENKDGKGEQQKEESSDDKKKPQDGSDAKNKEDKDKEQASAANDKDKKEKDNEFSKAAEKQNEKQEEEVKPQQKQPAPSAQKEQNKDAEKKGEAAKIEADQLSKEEKMAADQWLKRIPDDPGGLLRRKFRYQYQQRPRREGTGGSTPW